MKFGPVAQLVSAPACHAGGRGFEPRLDRKLFITKTVKKSEQSNGFESTERQLINFLRF